MDWGLVGGGLKGGGMMNMQVLCQLALLGGGGLETRGAANEINTRQGGAGGFSRLISRPVQARILINALLSLALNPKLHPKPLGVGLANSLISIDPLVTYSHTY